MSLSEEFSFPQRRFIEPAFEHVRGALRGRDEYNVSKILHLLDPIFRTYVEMTKFRHIRRQDWQHDHFIFFVAAKNGQATYRIIRHNKRGQLSIMDAGVPFEKIAKEHHRKQARPQNKSPLDQVLDGYITKTVGKDLENLRRHSKKYSEWVDALDFIVWPEQHSFQDFTEIRAYFVAQMMHAIANELPYGTSYKAEIQRCLLKDIESYDDAHTDDQPMCLAKIKDRLDPDVLRLVSRNPSALTTDNYNTLYASKNAERSKRFYNIIQRYPILMLVEKCADKLAQLDRNMNDSEAAAHLLGLRNAHEATFLETLNEVIIGADNAKHLPVIAPYVALAQEHGFKLDWTPGWTLLTKTVTFTRGLSAMLQRDPVNSFREIVQSGPEIAESIVERHARNKEAWALTQHKLRRHITSEGLGVTSKLWNRATKVLKYKMPLEQAMYLVMRHYASLPNVVKKRIPAAIMRSEGDVPFIHMIYAHYPLRTILEKTDILDRNRARNNRELGDRLTIARFDAHAEKYPWPTTPYVTLPGGIVVAPIRSQAELLAQERISENRIHAEGYKSLREEWYFVNVQGDGGETLGQLVLKKDTHGWWHETRPSRSFNGAAGNIKAVLDAVGEQYVDSLEFKSAMTEAVITQHGRHRAKYIRAIESDGKPIERFDFNPSSPSDNRTRHEMLLESTLFGDNRGEYDQSGCPHSPRLNAMVDAYLEKLLPFYPRETVVLGPSAPAA